MSASEDGLSETTIRFYWEGMLKSVYAVHKENIVHKDLKPANFLIVEGMLKLIGKAIFLFKILQLHCGQVVH